MPIALNGSGTITGISAGGLPDGCVTSDDIANNAVTTGKIAGNAVTADKLGTTEQGQLCKAWVDFNGTGTVAIRASYNVSSITDNGVGDYTVNFTTALADANHCTLVSTATNLGANHAVYAGVYPGGTYSTSAVRITVQLAVSGGFDRDLINVAIFR